MKACTPALAIPFVGPAVYAVCALGCSVVVIISCGTGRDACIGQCNSEYCCPVACGTRCCESQETCLSVKSGLCCAEGKTSCNGKQCIDPNEEDCLPSGGSCPKGTGRTCGNICCPDDGGINGATFCVDPDFGICCPQKINGSPVVFCKPPEITGPTAGVCCPRASCTRDGVCTATDF